MAARKYKIHIPDAELELLQKKLELSRIPSLDHEQWAEKNGVDTKLLQNLLQFWRSEYDWRREEELLNRLRQFTIPVDVNDFGSFDVHFVHSKTSRTDPIPLLFIHGWPGSFLEVQKILPMLNENGFDVVAPSLAGYGFTSYTNKAGLKHEHHVQMMHKLMLKLGYSSYVVQGGDWGSYLARLMGILYPQHVQAVHVNMFQIPKPKFDEEPTYTAYEQRCLDRYNWFFEEGIGYAVIQTNNPRTLGVALHDSPIGLLTWITDKLKQWSDNYPWTSTELITWTLLHYFPGPTTALAMYHENSPQETQQNGLIAREFCQVPTGMSVFPRDYGCVPQSWAKKRANIRWWREHESGGHFPAWEKPAEFVEDLTNFFSTTYQKA